MRPGSLRQDDQTADDEDRQDCRGQRAAQRKAAKTVIAASQGPGKGQFVNLAKAAWCPVSETTIPPWFAAGPQFFWASRCFRSDSRRIIRAIAARTASVRVRGFFTGAGALGFACLGALVLAMGIIGSICVGVDGLRSMGCIPIGPAWSEGACFLAMAI
jgi:hypothetical protein